MTQENITNRELIDRNYDQAGEQLQKQIIDWSDWKHWLKCASSLEENLRIVYMIGVLNQQVLNGGFCQYFNNSYGMFAYETLQFLIRINARFTGELVEKALEIVNHDKLDEKEFQEFIANNLIDDKVSDKLKKLDDQYYALEDVEDLEELLGNFLKTKFNKF